MVQSKNRYLNWVFVSENNACNSLNIPIWSQIEMDKNHLFVGSDDNFIYCIDKKDGSEIWRYQWFKIIDSDDDSEYYDYYDDYVIEYDEYGNEIIEPEEYLQFGDQSHWFPDENDRSYGWNLLVKDDILCVFSSSSFAELHLVDIQTGLGIKKINLSKDQSFHISHGFIIYKKDIYEEVETADPFGGVMYEKQLSKSDITVIIENVKKGEVCFEEQIKIKELKSIKSYLNDFISNNYKEIKKKIDYIDSKSKTQRYQINRDYQKITIYDNEKVILEIDNYDDWDKTEVAIIKDKLFMLGYGIGIKLLQLPSLTNIWKKDDYNLSFGFPFVDRGKIKYKDNVLHPRNFILCDIRTNHEVFREIGSIKTHTEAESMTPYFEDGIIYCSHFDYLNAINFSNGKEVIVINSWKDVFRRIFCEENYKGKIKIIWSLLIGLLKGKHYLKFINENDFPNRLMYIGSDGKNIFRFNYETGEVYWCVEAGRWIREAPITDEDNIYVGSNDGKLYSFKKDLK